MSAVASARALAAERRRFCGEKSDVRTIQYRAYQVCKFLK